MNKLFCLAAGLLLLAAPAWGGEEAFDQALAKAREGLAARDPVATLGSLRRAVFLAWRKLPFSFTKAQLVARPPTGFGRFLPRVDNIYRLGEPMILYVEPVGFTVRHDKKNQVYRYLMAADFNLVDAWGRVVSGRRKFGRFGGESRNFPDQIMLSFTYSLSGLPPGEYKVETILRDMFSKKSATVVTPIKVQGP